MTGLRRFAQWGLWFGGALILLAAVLIGIDVVLRDLFATSIGGADELAGYALAIGTAWALGATLLDRAHIRIDSLYVHAPVRVRLFLDLAGIGLLLGFFGLVAWHGLGVMTQSWTAGTRSQADLETPTVIPQTLWILGLIAFMIVGASVIAAAVFHIARGEFTAASHLISTRSAAEEAELEIQDIDRRRAEKDRP
jgi:TRAP-type mannitol/chloroaromatic compound transport system permease small subunit